MAAWQKKLLMLRDPTPTPSREKHLMIAATPRRELHEIEYPNRVSFFRTLLRAVVLTFFRPVPDTILATTLPNNRHIETHRIGEGPGSRYETFVFASRWGFEFVDRKFHDNLSAAYEGHASMIRRWATE